MRLPLRIDRQISIEQLPVVGITVHVIPSACARILGGTADLAALAGAFDRAEHLRSIRHAKERANGLQTIARGITRHGQESLKIRALVGDSSLITMSASSKH